MAISRWPICNANPGLLWATFRSTWVPLLRLGYCGSPPLCHWIYQSNRKQPRRTWKQLNPIQRKPKLLRKEPEYKHSNLTEKQPYIARKHEPLSTPQNLMWWHGMNYVKYSNDYIFSDLKMEVSALIRFITTKQNNFMQNISHPLLVERSYILDRHDATCVPCVMCTIWGAIWVLEKMMSLPETSVLNIELTRLCSPWALNKTTVI